MNTEEKELLLKEYSNRLPYGVKMRRPNKTTVLQVDGVCRSGGLGYVTYIDTNGQNESYGEISANGLVLFPIECLTKPITIASYNNGQPFVPTQKLCRLGDGVESKLMINHFSHWPQWIIEKLNEWHINYRLPDHLFVPVTETFNPYAK